MADLKLTATALYVDRYCEIGEKKKKQKQDAAIYCFQKYTINLKGVVNILQQNTKREATTFYQIVPAQEKETSLRK